MKAELCEICNKPMVYIEGPGWECYDDKCPSNRMDPASRAPTPPVTVPPFLKVGSTEFEKDSDGDLEICVSDEGDRSAWFKPSEVAAIQKFLSHHFPIGEIATHKDPKAVLAEIKSLIQCSREQWVTLQAPEDPEVLALCKRIGYGAVMDSASRQWYRNDPLGALVVSLAAGTERYVIEQIDNVLLDQGLTGTVPR